MRRDGESFGKLVQEDGEKDDDAQPGRNEKARADRHAVEKRVNRQAKDDRGAHVMMADFLGVGLFSKMKVLRQDVFEEMHQEKSGEHVVGAHFLPRA